MSDPTTRIDTDRKARWAKGVKKYRGSNPDKFSGEPRREAYEEALDGMNYSDEAKDLYLFSCFKLAAEYLVRGGYV